MLSMAAGGEEGKREEGVLHFSRIRFPVHYQGGKRRLAPKFAHVLDEALRGASCFVEPFVGGFNVVPALARAPSRVLCSDSHPGVIALWRAVQAGWAAPTELPETQYRELRRALDWSNPLTAFALFGCSYGGKADGGYARNARGAGYAAECARGIERKRPFLCDVEFTCTDYREIPVSPGAVVYCDPPYRGTKRYGGRAFDHAGFLGWCSEAAGRVFVSELAGSLPGEWPVRWSAARSVQLGRRHEVTEVLCEVGPRIA